MRRAEVLMSLLVIVFYAWTAGSGLRPFRFNGTAWDAGYYGLLAEAFRARQLHLLEEPSPELLALPDPYDYRQNEPYRLHDLSLYRGHYYLYWGPVPAIVLFWPWRMLTGHFLPESFAAFLFASTGFLFGCAVVHRRLRDPVWLRVLAVPVLGICGFVPHLLRRPAIYEVSIAAALAFAMAGIWCWQRAEGSPGWLALAGSCFGLAAGCRNLWLLPAGLILIATWWMYRHRAGIAFGVPVFLCAAGLAWYNYARFGDPLDFGIHYQLAYVTSREGIHPTWSKFVASLYYYLIAPPHFRATPPYLWLPRLPLPGGWMPQGEYVEEVVGLLSTTPVALLGMLAPWILQDRFRWIAWLAAVGTFVPMALLGWATLRYSVDFAPYWLLLGLLALAQLPANAALRAALLTTCLWGMTVNVATSLIGYDNGFERAHPGIFGRK